MLFVFGNSEVNKLNDSIRVLIGDDTANLGRILKIVLSRRGFTVRYCRSDYESVCNELSLFKPAALLLCAEQSAAIQAEFIRRIKEELPSLRIIMMSFSYSPEAYSLLAGAGINSYVIMPVTARELEKIIVEHTLSPGIEVINHFLIQFMKDNQLAEDSVHFSRLCTAVACSIAHPEFLDNMKERLYTYVAGRYGTTGSIIEHSIRSEARRLYELISISEIGCGRISFKSDGRLTSRELICIIADAFVSEYGLFDECDSGIER